MQTERKTQPTTAAAPTIYGSNIIPMVGNARGALSRSEAADLLGVSGKTIERMINRGELPGFRVGSRWRVLRRDMEAYVERQRAVERQRIGM
jgi:excisionase family DNA binding protein